MKNALVIVVLLLLVSCQSNNKESVDLLVNELGELHHTFEINLPAKEDFEKGLLLLHSFEYEDARDAFNAAIEADSSEIMAYWGAAMTCHKGLWGLQDLEAAENTMDQLGETTDERLARIIDPVEKDFWMGVEYLFGEGSFEEQNKKYADHMAKLHEKYPKNLEVTAFYALGLMWAGEGGSDFEGSAQAARIARGILEENPNHPGALHYVIHGFDNPSYAGQAKQAADLYAKVAPDAVHALHMPSHIYSALGMWDEMVSSNEHSYAASVRRMDRKDLKDGARGYHSFAWLHYGYLQQGRYEKAQELLDEMRVYVPRDPQKGARGYLVTMENSQLAECGQWKGGHLVESVKVSDLGISTIAKRQYFEGCLAAEQGDMKTLKKQIELLSNEIEVAKLEVGDEAAQVCGVNSARYAPNPNAIRIAQILCYQLKSLVAKQDGDMVAYENLLKEATAVEAASDYSSGPLAISLPSFEQYGDWLNEEKRYGEALEQFELSLNRASLRAHALKGKMKALQGLGKKEEAAQVQKKLAQIWQSADEEVKQLIAVL